MRVATEEYFLLCRA